LKVRRRLIQVERFRDHLTNARPERWKSYFQFLKTSLEFSDEFDDLRVVIATFDRRDKFWKATSSRRLFAILCG
jgi:hypothetical protein